MRRGSARAADTRSAAAKARPGTPAQSAFDFACVVEKYTDTALHFEVEKLPHLLERNLPRGPLTFADFGCGDGPLFRILAAGGHIGPGRAAYAMDLEPARLARVSARFPWIETVVASVDHVPAIGDESLQFVCSTMVMEHVPDERAFLNEIHRVLRPGGARTSRRSSRSRGPGTSAAATARPCSIRHTSASRPTSGRSVRSSSRRGDSESSRSSADSSGSRSSIRCSFA
jgi:ubiquinone/menaquinone biosynthesis C-methylase UbiE